MTKRFIVLLWLGFVLTGCCSALPVAAANTPTPLPTQPVGTTLLPLDMSEQAEAVAEAKAEVFDLINQQRQAHGLRPVARDRRLMRTAQAYSEYMAQENFFDHISPDGSDPGDRISRRGYEWNFYGENLACGYASAAAAVQGWMDSPEHRATLLHPRARELGVGLAVVPGTDCIYYWTALFAAGD